LHMQVKLLRVIQEKTIRPIGESREELVDVRILSATHRNLAQLVAEGRFREDLYYRIDVIELRVPSLRERPEDIPELIEAIITRLARRIGLDAPAVSVEAMAALQSYSFPGNVRELENILERALTLCTSGVIAATDIQLRRATAPAAVDEPAAVAGTAAGLGGQLEDLERDAIVKALEQTRYNKTAAAKLLGISFRALRYRVKKLGIE
jgi:two-component system response regulator PilR (NtrC family)